MVRPMLFAMFVLAAAGGCEIDLGPPYLDLSTRSPIPVEAEVDKLLTQWQQQHAEIKSLYATFKRTVKDQAFKTVQVANGSLRYRHSDRGRMDIEKNEKGIGRELFLWTKDHEFWLLMVDDRRASIYALDEKFLANFMAGSWFVWLIPADKTMVQKHGRITKLKEDGATVVLRVENTRYANEPVYQTATVHLRKPLMSLAKIIVQENPDLQVTYEFTAIHNDVELSESDFTPPKLNSNWKVDRIRPENGLWTVRRTPKADKDQKSKRAPSVAK